MSQITTWRRSIAVLVISALLAACGQGGAAQPDSAALESVTDDAAVTQAIMAVATTTIIADMVANVGGERVQVRSLLPPGADPHSYSPAPGDVQAIATAQIVFENGLGLDEWLDEIIANAGGARPRVVVTDGLTPIEGDAAHADDHADEHATADAHDDAAHADDHGHAHDEDPHMWFDVQRAVGYVENIRDGLKQIDPDGADTYDSNAAAYIEQLRQLDREIEELTRQVPAERRKLVTNHDTFGYFAERYDFTVIGTVFEGVSTEQEPSAQQIAQLVRRIREAGVPAIFTENTVNPRLAEQVANEAGVRVVTDLYTDALGAPGSAGDTYIKMMRHNTQQIVEALK